MEKESWSLRIENDLRPAYYDDFHCLMGECKLSCCRGGWNITFDKKDYLTLKRVKGTPELEAKLAGCVHRCRKEHELKNKYGEFLLENGSCCEFS